MSIEQALAENTAALKALAIVMSSGVALSGATSDAAATPASTKKTATAPAPSPTAGPAWKDALEAVKAVNSSDKPKAGKAGVLAILKKFGKENEKVPALEALNKHAEIVAFANSLLADAPSDAATDGDDLGI